MLCAAQAQHVSIGVIRLRIVALAKTTDYHTHTFSIPHLKAIFNYFVLYA